MRIEKIVAFVRSQLVGFLALFVALGGISYAAVALPDDSVGTAQLKKQAVSTQKLKQRSVSSAKIKLGAVRTNHIRDGAVTGSRIREGAISSFHIPDGSLLASDFAGGQLPAGPRGSQGPAGPHGAAGPVGPTGPVGPQGETGEVDLSAAGRVANILPTYGEDPFTAEQLETNRVRGRFELTAPADGFLLLNVTATLRATTPVTGTCVISSVVEEVPGLIIGSEYFDASSVQGAVQAMSVSRALAVEAGPVEYSVVFYKNPYVSTDDCAGTFNLLPTYGTALWVPYELTG